MSALALGPAAAPVAGPVTADKADAAASAAAVEEPLVDKEAVVSTEALVPETEETVQPRSEVVAEAQAEAQEAGEVIQGADVVVPGNAAFQDSRSKKAEASEDCQGTRLATSKMLGEAGVVASDDGGIWGTVLLLVAAGAAVLLVAVLVVRGVPKADERLKTFATVIAIASGALGMVVTFVPGVKGSDRPAEEATMTVREVHPRITLREFARGTRTSLDEIEDRTDLREIGNVIWLEIALRGYANRRPVLQYGLYQLSNELLLDNTAKDVPLHVEDADAQTSFVPIWVGYPTDKKFQAQFRLTVDGRVRQMARTEGMSGSTIRYSCPR